MFSDRGSGSLGALIGDIPLTNHMATFLDSLGSQSFVSQFFGEEGQAMLDVREIAITGSRPNDGLNDGLPLRAEREFLRVKAPPIQTVSTVQGPSIMNIGAAKSGPCVRQGENTLVLLVALSCTPGGPNGGGIGVTMGPERIDAFEPIFDFFDEVFSVSVFFLSQET